MTHLLTTLEAATYLHLHADTLRRWRRERRGPAFVRVRRQIRYDPNDLDAYVDACREGGEAL
jgi:excisionase family DNA binding protein